MASAQVALPRRLSDRQSLEKLARCAEGVMDSPEWWDCVERHLLALREELAHQDIAALVDQVLVECPERGIRAARTRLEHDDLQVAAARLSALIAGRNQLRGAAGTVRSELRSLLVRAHRVDEQTDVLLLDAYGLDIGGGD